MQHAQDGLAFNYDKLDEMEPALLYAGKALPMKAFTIKTQLSGGALMELLLTWR
jgi:hypothetical protein